MSGTWAQLFRPASPNSEQHENAHSPIPGTKPMNEDNGDDMNAKLYIRRNGAFGSSCDGTQDTGHHIAEDSGKFTVYSIHDPDVVIAQDATREEAEAAIVSDWRGLPF